jgi:DNA-binding transcriptional ArsR family regulator
MVVAETFKALGDPVRLEMVRRLSSGSTYTVGTLSDGLGVTRQGARKHLDVLVKAEIVFLKPKGRETEVKLEVASLEAAREFIAEMEGLWDARLRALRVFVEGNAGTAGED